MNESLWTFLFEIANFVALAAALTWLFFKPVRKALADQRAKTEQKEEETTSKLAEAERLRKEIVSQRETLTTDLEAMRIKASEAAKHEADQIIADARAEIEREMKTLKRETLQIEQAQSTKIARAVAIATRNTIERFLRQIDGPEIERTLIEAVCRELQTYANDSLAPVTVESATQMDDELRQLINASLGTAAKSADFRVVPDLKGGLRISTAHGLIDASVTGLANFAEQSLSASMESMIGEESQDE